MTAEQSLHQKNLSNFEVKILKVTLAIIVGIILKKVRAFCGYRF